MSGIVGGAGSKSGVVGRTEIYYEEGTFEVVSGESLVSHTERYTRIGNQCTISFYGSFSGSPSGDLTFTGLPFAPGSSCQTAGSVTIISLEATQDGYYSAIIYGTTTVSIRRGGLTTDGTDAASQMDTGTQFWCGFTYPIT